MNLYLLATHRDMWGKGRGQATLDRIWDEVDVAILSQSVTSKVVMKADVHKQNARCKKLLARNGWSYLEDDPDGVHEVWAVVAE
ncbi:hypothetical protein ACFRJ9_15935 [Paenarthrobacter sp. NPDC056912]|uniref:hypothetical protein n=1 Tax=Paenarthrobacter sp. NPDC056912 TaxID=3345965 RepID=UPI0036724625